MQIAPEGRGLRITPKTVNMNTAKICMALLSTPWGSGKCQKNTPTNRHIMSLRVSIKKDLLKKGVLTVDME
jgi:hypothetical protein